MGLEGREVQSSIRSFPLLCASRSTESSCLPHPSTHKCVHGGGTVCGSTPRLLEKSPFLYSLSTCNTQYMLIYMHRHVHPQHPRVRCSLLYTSTVCTRVVILAGCRFSLFVRSVFILGCLTYKWTYWWNTLSLFSDSQTPLVFEFPWWSRNLEVLPV